MVISFLLDILTIYTKLKTFSVIFINSKDEGEQVLAKVSFFIENRLKLTVNQAKSKVDHVSLCSVLGIDIKASAGDIRLNLSSKAQKRFKERINYILGQKINLQEKLDDINAFLDGWINYYKIIDTPEQLLPLHHYAVQKLSSVYGDSINPGQEVKLLCRYFKANMSPSKAA